MCGESVCSYECVKWRFILSKFKITFVALRPLSQNVAHTILNIALFPVGCQSYLLAVELAKICRSFGVFFALVTTEFSCAHDAFVNFQLDAAEEDGAS